MATVLTDKANPFDSFIQQEEPEGSGKIANPFDQYVAEQNQWSLEQVKQQDQPLEEAWNPIEILPTIFTGGTYAAWRVGGKSLGAATRRGAVESVVGTVTDIPVHILGRKVSEWFGWPVGLAFELSTSFLAGATVDEYMVNKLMRRGERAAAKVARDEELAELTMNEVKKVTDFRRSSVEAAPEEMLEPIQRNTYEPPADSLLRTREAQTAEAAKRAQQMSRQTPGQREVPAEARRIMDAAESAAMKRQQEVAAEDAIYGAEDEAIRQAQIPRREAERARPAISQPKERPLPPKDEVKIQKAREAAQRESAKNMAQMKRTVPANKELPDKAQEIMNAARKASEKRAKAVAEEAVIYEDDVIAAVNRERKAAGLAKYSEKDKIEVPEAVRTKAKEFEANVQQGKAKDVPPVNILERETKIAEKASLRAENTEGFETLKPSELKIKRKAPGQYRVSDGKNFTEIQRDRELGAWVENGQWLGETKDEALGALKARWGHDSTKAFKPTARDEFAAYNEPAFEDELMPSAPTKGARELDRTQKDMEEFLGENLEGFEGGRVKPGYENEVGYSHEVELFDDDYIDPDNIYGGEYNANGLWEETPDSWGQTMHDLYQVFGKKIGLTIEDAVTGSADEIAAQERLITKLKKHHQTAMRMGVDFEQYLVDTQQMDRETASWIIDRYQEFLTPYKAKEAKNVTEKAFKNPTRFLSIEYPFKRIGAPESGHAFKVYFGIRDLHSEVGVKTSDQITRLDGIQDANEGFLAAVKAERPDYDLSYLEPESRARIEAAAKRAREYFDQSYKEMSEAGVLYDPFPEVAIARRQQKIQDLKAGKIKNKDIDSEIAKLENEIETLRNTEYVPILRSWFNYLDRTQPDRMSRIIQVTSRKERQTTMMKELVDRGIVKPEEADIRNLIGTYARRKGKDMAAQNIVNKLEADGLAKRWRFRNSLGDVTEVADKKSSEFEGLVRLDTRKFPAYKDYMFHPRVADYMERFFKGAGKQGTWEKGMNASKMAQFFNPVILPMYDTYQSVMLRTGFGPKGLVSLPKDYAEAAKSVLTKDDDWYNAVKNGATSKPFDKPYGDWMETIEKTKLPMKHRVLAMIDPRAKTGTPWKDILGTVSGAKTVKNIYDLSWNTAWLGDEITRIADYRALKKRGATDREAAQLSALFHGDYASVPPQTRKALNKVFFTPTFKIAMGKLYKEMGEANVKMMSDFAQKQMPSMKRRALAAGLLGAIAVNQAKDWIMTSMGFERDTWGVRYHKTIETDEGPKDIVIPLSDPANMFVKYAARAYDAFLADTSAGDKTGLGKWLQSMSYELHPAIRIITNDLATRTKWNGERIYSPFDSPEDKLFNFTTYAVSEFIPLFKALGLHAEDEKVQKRMKKEFGTVMTKGLELIAFPYLTETQKTKLKWEQKQLMRNAFEEAQKGEWTEERQENLEKQVQQLYDKYNELE